ncbi:hypothetical protein D3C84_996490 [compost metagenome]
MGQRLELQTLLEGVLGTENVYFQPPSNMQIKYPCIVYARDNAKSEFADNSPYRYTKRYQVTVISRDPDTLVPDDVAQLPLSNLNRIFTADNLHHYVYNLYF